MLIISRLDMLSYQNKKGFTITEVIVSGLIVAVLAAGVFSAFFEAQHLLNRARHRTQAYNFATEALDKLRSNYKYGDVEMTAGAGVQDASGISCSIQGDMAALTPVFTYTVTEPQVNGYKEVVVSVQWNEPAF